MSTGWQAVTDHARRHHGTVGWDDLAALELTGNVSAWVRAGRIQRTGPGAYVVVGSAPSWFQQVCVATVSSGGWASHRTAAALWRLDGFGPGRVEVLVPYGSRRRTQPGWRIHETRALRSVDLDDVDGIPATSLVRTLIDLAAVAHPVRVAQALDDACRRHPGTLEAVAARHAELARRGRRGTVLVRRLLEERYGAGSFAASGFEALTVRLVRGVGMPAPVLQHPVRDGDFVAFLDLAWPDIRWLVECDSLAHHSGKRAHEWDRVRRRRLKRLGWDGVEVTYDDVTKRAAVTARELRQLYDARAAAFRQT